MIERKQLESLIDDYRRRYLSLWGHTWTSPAHKYLWGKGIE
jgi:hypothetical protein